MKTSQRFDRAIQALVKGYLDSTLAKGTCTACAVGNICAAANGIKIIRRSPSNLEWGEQDLVTLWDDVFVTIDSRIQRRNPHNYTGEVKKQIDATGYTWQELAKVESAFESNTRIHIDNYTKASPEEVDADQLAGLHAVVDVLCEIEGITDAGEYKALFAKPALTA